MGIVTRLYHFYIRIRMNMACAQMRRRLSPVLKDSVGKLKKNRGSAKSVFIVCTGPSLRAVELSKIQNETLIGVSNLLFHPQYSEIKPAYHVECPSHAPYTEAEWVDNYKKMSEAVLEQTIYVVNFGDKEKFQKAKTFSNENFAYYQAFSDIHSNPNFNFEFPIPNVQTGSILALMLALHLGFEKIFLLGVDHDYFPTMNYERCHDSGSGVGSDSLAMVSQTTLLRKMHAMWEQYDWIHSEAKLRGAQIFNLNPKSALEVFPKISIEKALSITARESENFEKPHTLPRK